MKRLVLAIAVLLVAAQVSHASVVGSYELDGDAGGTVTTNVFTLTLLGLMDGGVTFDATLTGTGSANIDQTASTGLGITGGSSALINPGESIGFTISTSNVIGGTVTFDGFTEITLSSLTTVNEQGVLSVDGTLDNPGDSFVTSDGPHDVATLLSSPTTLTVFGFQNGAVNSSFRALTLQASFTGVAVPEASSMLFGGLAGAISLAGWAWRRRSIA